MIWVLPDGSTHVKLLLMALLDIQNITVAFGGPPVLDNANFSIERGERVCLLGRNGTGKSTLMRVLDGTNKPDQGEVVRQTGLTVARLDQEVPEELSGTIFEVAASGLGATGELLAKYQQASQQVAEEGSEAALRTLDRLHRALDSANGWEVQSRVESVLEKLKLNGSARFASASGGRKRQTLLARALVGQPDVLLLDEPTNHLDVNAIEWLEDFLISNSVTLVFVTHDRAFLRRVATRIVELDRGRLLDWGDDYDSYLERKDAALAAESTEWAEFDKKLAKEEVWIRTGIQARRTRNEGRVRALEALRRERSARRDRTGTVSLNAMEAERSGRVVFDIRGVSLNRGNKVIARNFSAIVGRGDRIGLIGPNGIGKTSLIKLLLGELTPNTGEIRRGTNLEVAYFDQLRDQLDGEKSVFDNIADGSDFVEVGGVRKHIHGYLQDFLFSPERVRTPVKALSGGERNRLLLARLFTRSFNVLVLDEPTNDLDMETLDLLEDMLLGFSGTLLLVSHDREFVDNVVTGTFAFEGNGVIREYAGGYSDWVRQRKVNDVRQTNKKSEPRRSVKTGVVDKLSSSLPKAERKRKLTYTEQHELKSLPDRIEKLEAERDKLYVELSDPDVLRNGELAAQKSTDAERLEGEIVELMERWELLEGMV